MKALVDSKKALTLMDGAFQFGVQVLQTLPLRRAGLGGHHSGGVALQQSQQVVHVAQVFVRHLGDIRTAAHFHRHQAFSRQHFERFTQRRAADAKFFGNFEFINPTAWFQRTIEDTLAQLLGYFLVQGAGGQGDCGHSGEMYQTAGFKTIN